MSRGRLSGEISECQDLHKQHIALYLPAKQLSIGWQVSLHATLLCLKKLQHLSWTFFNPQKNSVSNSVSINTVFLFFLLHFHPQDFATFSLFLHLAAKIFWMLNCDKIPRLVFWLFWFKISHTWKKSFSFCFLIRSTSDSNIQERIPQETVSRGCAAQKTFQTLVA